MNITERIETIREYFHSMNVAAENGIIYVLVQFPKGWGCSEVTEHNFNVKAVRDENPEFYYFFANLSVGFDKVFDAIEYNIQFNLEAQAKVNLLRSKIDELRDIFEKEDIDTLKTLEFKYKQKKTRTPKTKKQEKENTPTTTNTVASYDGDEQSLTDALETLKMQKNNETLND
jgi:hypothetical protein